MSAAAQRGRAADGIVRAAARALAAIAARGQRRLSILIFHRVLAAPDPLFPGEMYAARFDATMAAVAATFNVLPLPDAVERLGRNALPARAVAITFDDGYADNLTVACPILARHGLHATFFVASGFLDGGIMWNDQAIEAVRGCAAPAIDLTPLGLGVLPLGSIAARRDALGRILPKLKYLSLAGRVDALSRLRASAGARPNPELMMTTAQLRALRDAGMEIGGHTCSHPILAVLPDDVARREIGADREQLAGILGQPPRLFAYPNGKPGEDYLPVHVEMVRALGYHHALSTQWGAAGRGSDRFQLPRFTPWDQDPRRFVLRLAHNFGRSRPADRKT